MSSKFQVIVADPPWDFSDSLKMSNVPRSARSNYMTMPMSYIKQLPIKDYADPNGAILALWVPSSLLQEGLNTMSAWGFNHKQTYVWVKNKKNPFGKLNSSLIKNLKVLMKNNDGISWGNIKKLFNDTVKPLALDSILCFGMGRLFRQTHEICLIGTNNNAIYKSLFNKSQRSVSFGENLKHSSKPEHLQDSLELMFPSSKKIELFARRVRPNWVCLGNEICNGEDIAVSLSKL